MSRIPEINLPKLTGAYIVGGSIRDLLLGHPPADYDLAVLGRPEAFAAEIASVISGRIVTLGSPGETLYRIVSPRMMVDISQANGDCIEADLGQRDFTINAMAYDLSQDRLIDPFGGMADLSGKTIRMVSDRVFRKDPIRLLRAYRLAAVLDFGIDPETEQTVMRDASRVRETAPERIRYELIRFLGTPDAFFHLSRMMKNGLLFSIIPEFSDLNGCLQNTHHRLDVLSHTLEAFSHLERLLNGMESVFPDHVERLKETLPTERCALLKCAILLHDIEKPSVITSDTEGRVHFYGHEKRGAETAEAICRRLRFSNYETAFLRTVILYHLRPLLLFQNHLKNRLSHRAITRFFMTAKDITPAVLLHALADFQGKKGSGQCPFRAFIKDLMDRYYSQFQPKQALPPLISGKDLIHRFGLTPSPRFKDILSQIQEAGLSGRISTRKEALARVEKLLLRDP